MTIAERHYNSDNRALFEFIEARFKPPERCPRCQLWAYNWYVYTERGVLGCCRCAYQLSPTAYLGLFRNSRLAPDRWLRAYKLWQDDPAITVRAMAAAMPCAYGTAFGLLKRLRAYPDIAKQYLGYGA